MTVREAAASRSRRRRRGVPTSPPAARGCLACADQVRRTDGPQEHHHAPLARIRAAIDRAIREGRATEAEIVEMVEAMGGSVSQSAVSRYARSAREQMKTYRQAQEIAAVWAKRMEEQPNGDVAAEPPAPFHARLQGPLRHQRARRHPDDAEMRLMLLGKALDHLSKAERTTLERDLKVRKRSPRRPPRRRSRRRRRAGSAEAAEAIRRDILGLAS